MSAAKNSVHPLVVHLVLTYHWFDEMVNLRKHVEYRAMTPHWKRLIWDRRNEIAAARFSRGYTAETILRPVIGIDVGPCPYDGWTGDFYRMTLGLITEHNRRRKNAGAFLRVTVCTYLKNQGDYEKRTHALCR